MKSLKIKIILCVVFVGLMVPTLSHAWRGHNHGGYAVHGWGYTYPRVQIGFYGYPFAHRPYYHGYYGYPAVYPGYNGWVNSDRVRYRHGTHVVVY